jgi:hypothetical protein
LSIKIFGEFEFQKDFLPSLPFVLSKYIPETRKNFYFR